MIFFDTETEPFDRAYLAPEPICMSWAPGPDFDLVDNCKDRFTSWLEGQQVLCGVHIAYDMAVLGEYWPDLLPLIFKKYNRGQVQDLAINQKIIDIAKTGMALGKYSMEELANRYGIPVSKGTVWRKEFKALKGVPKHLWPQEPKEYVLGDATIPQRIADCMPEVEPAILAGAEARKAFALQLISCWGVKTDRERVLALEAKTKDYMAKARVRLQEAGLVRANGTRDTKAAKARMAEVVKHPSLTDTGEIACDKQACKDSGDELLQLYSTYSQANTLMARVEDLKNGVDLPLQVRFNSLLETSRTSTSKPKPPLVGVQLQNFPREVGARECLVARPDHVIISCDLPTAELRSLSQNNIDMFGFSVMGEQLNAGRDLHLWFGAQIMGLEYKEALRRFEAGDKDVKLARQNAKPCNFGYPGGMGVANFCDFAWATYGIRFSLEEAERLKKVWMAAFPEMKMYFGRVSKLLWNKERCTLVHLRTGRIRGRVMYCQAANSPFQELTAVGASEGLCAIQEICYTDRTNPLWNSRVIMYQHDEIVGEVPEKRMHWAGLEMSRIMAQEFNRFHPDVPAHPCTGPGNDARVIYPEAGYHYSKNLKTVWTPEGKLTVCSV